MRKIIIECRNDIRNGQLDYYGADSAEIWFQMKDTGVELYNFLILIHSMVEYITTQARGIPLALIDKFDEHHLDSEEPGDEVNSPYRNEHNMAVGIERILCAYMNIPWKTYEEALIKSLGDDQ